MLKNIIGLLKNDEGASLVEYALIVALISVVAIVVLTQIGTRATAKLQTASDALK